MRRSRRRAGAVRGHGQHHLEWPQKSPLGRILVLEAARVARGRRPPPPGDSDAPEVAVAPPVRFAGFPAKPSGREQCPGGTERRSRFEGRGWKPGRAGTRANRGARHRPAPSVHARRSFSAAEDHAGPESERRGGVPKPAGAGPGRDLVGRGRRSRVIPAAPAARTATLRGARAARTEPSRTRTRAPADPAAARGAGVNRLLRGSRLPP